MVNKKINAVIVVEGKKDTQRLRLIDPDVKTIETRGAAVNEKVVSLIKKALKNNQVIVLTDPDFSGERIRRFITKEIPEIKQAFIRPKEGIPHKKNHRSSLGVEHASDISIINAISEVSYEKKEKQEKISLIDLNRLGLINSSSARLKRKQILEKLNLGYANGNHFAERLSLAGISISDLENILREINE